MARSGSSLGGQRDQVDPTAMRAWSAYGHGIRTSLRRNATAYGFSVSITATFGLVANSHPRAPLVVPVILFAAGAAGAFMLLHLLAWWLFRNERAEEASEVQILGGTVDVLAIMLAVLVAVASSRIPGIAAWPLAAFVTTWVYLLVGGVDVLIARLMAR